MQSEIGMSKVRLGRDACYCKIDRHTSGIGPGWKPAWLMILLVLQGVCIARIKYLTDQVLQRSHTGFVSHSNRQEFEASSSFYKPGIICYVIRCKNEAIWTVTKSTRRVGITQNKRYNRKEIPIDN